jgi:hypothetical protein
VSLGLTGSLWNREIKLRGPIASQQDIPTGVIHGKSTGNSRILTTTKMGGRGQLTVPKQFRRDLGLGMGAPFAVLRLGDGLVLLPEQQRFTRSACRV